MSQEVELRDGSSGTVKEIYGMTAQDKQDYIDFVVAQFNAADNSGKLDIVSKELMIAAWGNGLEAYNLYRRTGMPSNMAPALESAPGAFPKSFLLPADHVNRNSNVDQRSMTDPVFWNANGPDLY